MSGRHWPGSNRYFRHRFWWRAFHRTLAVSAMLFLVAEIAAVAVSTVRPSRAQAAPAPAGQGFTVTAGDLHFIMKQIKIAERHSATLTASNPCGTLVGPNPDQIPDRLTPYGLRTVDGSCNNLFPTRERFGAADELLPRLTTTSFRDADPDPTAVPPVAGVPPGCSPSHKTLFIPNVTTDVGLSPPYNSLFTFFGQFFDHGVDQTVKSGANVFVPLKADDPLRTLGPDGIPDAPAGQPGSHAAVPAYQAFMVLTRAQNQPGPDGVLGDDPATPQDESADDIQDATNTDSPWVDQSQTYTSHPAHQAYLREYSVVAGKPVDTGKLLGGTGNGATGMATWA